MIDLVAQPLHEAVILLENLNIKHTVVMTEATNKKFLKQQDCLYVIRQHIADDGSYTFIAAAKMGKEV